MNAIILAGGQGTRLWPMSRRMKPKQFFPILSDLPLIAEVYERLRIEFEPEHIFVATLEPFKPLIQALIQELPEENIFTEPAKRDSGPGMALAAWEMQKRGLGADPMVFIPTDHFIGDSERFLQTILLGGQLVNETGKLIDISVTPEFASTTLGYTKIGTKQLTREGIDVYEFVGHTEKPDMQTAMQYMQSGDYLWHANYYTWTPDKFIEAFEAYAPEIHKLLVKMDKANERERAEHFQQMPSISIDYAVTEKMDPQDALIIRGDFGWSDIGAWDVLHSRMLKQKGDEQQNVTKGNVVALETRNSLIYAEQKLVTTLGINDLVVVDTEDSLLICPKSRAQDIKLLIKHLEESGFDQQL